MQHEEAMNTLLSHACGCLSDEESIRKYGSVDVNEYDIELHCHSFRVVAKSLGGLRYEVLQMKER